MLRSRIETRNDIALPVEIRSPQTPSEWAAYYDLRWRLLRAPWGQPRGSERDEFEAAADHLLACVSSDTAADPAREPPALLGVGRIHLVDPTLAQIRYVAVRDDTRGRGIGQGIVGQLEAIATQRKVERIEMNAREGAIAFYERLGYRITGPAPTLFGQIVQQRMAKQLGTPRTR